MIGQSLGGMLVGLECILTQPVNIFCDTIGAAFTFPIVKLLSGYQIKVIAYVHYPIISSVSSHDNRPLLPHLLHLCFLCIGYVTKST